MIRGELEEEGVSMVALGGRNESRGKGLRLT